MRLLLLAALFCLAWCSAMGQNGGGIYAAPGMPLHVQRGVPKSPRPVKKAGVSTAKRKADTANATAPIVSPVFARFWHLAGLQGAQAGQLYYRFQQQNIRYPVTSLRAGVGGTVAARLTVLPDGRVGTVQITRRVYDSAVASIEAPSLAAEAALDAEFIRVVSQLKFEPAAIPADTVTVNQRFVMQ
ncbi:hypothetical protein [Hymenobacter sp. UYCo722]|uniref:energy transducer TonB n=1 Tax=Hymenobacter sp. UYCo722 TaxID=3156335 RepID=UPI00339A0B3F